jgi:transcriptional regulator with XRE-family HTH domain
MELFLSIGDRLREERDARGMSQSDFAEIAAHAGVPGATRQSQARYEKGIQTPGAAYLAAIAAAGIDVLYILTGERSAGIPPPSRRGSALLDNYEHLSEDDKRALERLAFSLAKQALRKVAA